jgi:hypothetical protein
MSELIDYFVRSYTLAMDNDEGAYGEAMRVTHEAIFEETPDITREAYRAMSDEDRVTAYAEAIGTKVLELIDGWVDELLGRFDDDEIGALLIRETLRTNGSDLAWELGKHYIPESHYDADINWLPEADEDDAE